MLAAGALLCASCGSYTYLPKPKQAHLYPRGAQVSIAYSNGWRGPAGELIAVGAHQWYVLQGVVYAVPDSAIGTAVLRVARTSDNPGAIEAWAALMPFTTLYHGIGMLFSLPVNLAVAIPVGVDASASVYSIYYPGEIRKEDVYKFARFPQGIPEGVNLNELGDR